MGSRWVSALLAAAACAAALFWTWILAFRTAWGGEADQRVYDAFRKLDSHLSNVLALKVTTAGNTPWFALAAAILVAVAAVRGGRWLALIVVAVLVGANATTQALQQLTATPRHPLFLPEASWPSGHTTAFAALAVVLVLVVPRRLRSAAALAGAAATLLMGYSTLVLGTHHPSDAVGAVLVAGLWAGAMVALMRIRDLSDDRAGTSLQSADRRADVGAGHRAQ